MRPPIQLRRAFTLIEMLVVMAVIALLAAIILNLNGLVQGKAARSRAEVEIKAISAGCDSYKADNGSYPQSSDTDALDPRVTGDPNNSAFQKSSLFLYEQLSGDLNANGRNEPNGTPPETKNYLPEFFTPQRLGGKADTNGAMMTVTFLKDPFGNCYGYSTAGLKAATDFRTKLSTSTNPTSEKPDVKGYNPSFDLWSTGGKTTAPGGTPDVTNVWIKNW